MGKVAAVVDLQVRSSGAGQSMNGRSYLSIGDVLTLLQQEFPDVTISKIRFLESQGLVNPERTPSGYRKFYGEDVDRLRWVLRQQREHFLPLKVIKGRLEAGHGAGASRLDGGAMEGATSPVPEENGHSTPEHGVQGAPTSGHGSQGPPAGSLGSTAPEGDGEVGLRSSGAAANGGAAGGSHRSGGSNGGAGGVDPGPPRVEPGGQLPGFGPESTAPGPGDGSAVSTGGVAMGRTLDEVVEQTGLDPAEVAELASYGLMTGRSVGGVVYYDDDEALIATLAASFRRYGVEPRHLRLHKQTADREAGFIEQIILPLVKQRNPDAHRRAAEAVTELGELGQALRQVLLRRVLRDRIG